MDSKAWWILLAEEQAEIIARAISPRVVAPAIRYEATEEGKRMEIRTGRTRRRVEKDRVVMGDFEILNTGRGGRLREFVVVSPSSDFRIFMSLDDEVVFNDSWQNLHSMNAYAQEYNATYHEDNGKYWFSTDNWSWERRCILKVATSSQIVFDTIYAVWDEY